MQGELSHYNSAFGASGLSLVSGRFCWREREPAQPTSRTNFRHSGDRTPERQAVGHPKMSFRMSTRILIFNFVFFEKAIFDLSIFEVESDGMTFRRNK